jgi:hypothetical protein
LFHVFHFGTLLDSFPFRTTRAIPELAII